MRETGSFGRWLRARNIGGDDEARQNSGEWRGY